MNVTKGLIIDTSHIDRILAGEKTWEMRSTATKQRGRIALIRKRSGTIVGTVNLVDSVGPLTREQMLKNFTKHCVCEDRIQNGLVDKWPYAWVMNDAVGLNSPLPYRHPLGAVMWITLDEGVADSLN